MVLTRDSRSVLSLHAFSFMTRMEHKVLTNFETAIALSIHCQYVGDMLSVVPEAQAVHNLKEQTEFNSVFKFTRDIKNNKNLKLLGCMVTKTSCKLATKVHTEVTSNCQC